MNDELKAAAARMRSVEHSWADLDDPAMGCFSDALAISKAYLAEHPSDDDELLDSKWLRSVGFERFMQPAGESSMSLQHLILRRYPREPEWKVYVDGTHFPMKARGDVRRLCKVLSIELKA